MPDSYIIRCPSCHTANRVPATSEGRSGKCGGCHQHLPALYTKPLELDDRSLGEFSAAYPGTILVEFWAPW